MNNIAKNKIPKRGHATESERSRMLLGDYRVSESISRRLLLKLVPQELSIPALLSIGELISAFTGTKMDRDYKRTKKLIYKWFDIHYEMLVFILSFVVLTFVGPNGNTFDIRVSDKLRELQNEANIDGDQSKMAKQFFPRLPFDINGAPP